MSTTGYRRPVNRRRPPQKRRRRRLSQSPENIRKRRRFYTICVIFIVVLIIIIASTAGHGKKKEETPAPVKPQTTTLTLAPVKLNDHWGYINQTGKLVISYKFLNASSFGPNGMAAVEDENQNWGYINTKGAYVIQPRFKGDAYGSAPIGMFTANGLAPYKDSTSGKYGFINEKGSTAIQAEYDSVREFADNGLAAVCQNGLWGYIDKNGSTVLPLKYADAGDFGDNGYAPVKVNSGSYYSYINRSGKEVIPASFRQAYPFHHGLAAVQMSSGVYQYIDKSGLPKFTQTFISLRNGHIQSTPFAGSFAANGLAPATQGTGTCGYINTSGSFTIEPQYYRADNFSDCGLAAVETKEYLWGFIDKSGQTAITPQYQDAGSFTQVVITK